MEENDAISAYKACQKAQTFTEDRCLQKSLDIVNCNDKHESCDSYNQHHGEFWFLSAGVQ